MKRFSKPFLALLVLVVTVFGPVACGASEAVVAQKSLSAVSALKSVAALAVSTTALPPGVDRNAYLAIVEASGGTPGYTWSISSGSLPSGLELIPNTGLITGTPKQPGTSTFTLAVSDKGKPIQTASRTFSITTLVPLAITTSALSSSVTESTYTTTLQATGGTPPYRWSVSSGSLPSGLSLDPTSGKIAGTPGVSGTSTFSVTVVDHGILVQNTTRTFSITTLARLAITTSVLASPVNGFAYNAALQATGGVPPYSWSISSGSLPQGLTLNAGSGAISGTPTGSGPSNFVAMVTDSGNPEQTAALTTSISTIGRLSVPSVALPVGTGGIAYAAKMLATGGVPAYTWSIASGSLPNGLTLAATTGVISGTPTLAGTFNFAARVVDNGSPIQALTVRASIKINPAAAIAAALPAGTTWYVRADGGTPYTPNRASAGLSTQCDGKADAPYSGVGNNQHCAFNDYRFLWDDQATYGTTKWVISGGDTVILDNATQWRVGFDVSSGGDPSWCRGGPGTYGCINPTIPAGTPAQHTRILGRNWATCHNGNVADRTQMTQIFGGHGVYTPMNISDTQYVDIACLEITQHSDCYMGGLPAPAAPRHHCTTADDYDSDGIEEDAATANITMTDLWVHGHPGRGVKGPIGGPMVATNVTLSYNESAGWDFDDGNATPFGAGASWTFNYSTIEWSGCYQEYPMVHTIPVYACYDQNNQGYGDGVGSAPGQWLSSYVNHSTFNYNVQDGLDLGHVDGGHGTFSLTNSTAVGNGGATYKWGWGFDNILVESNLAEANCAVLAYPIVGAEGRSVAPLTAQGLCRGGDALSFNFNNASTALFANNTILTYAATTFDYQCVPISGQINCDNTVFSLQNNIVRAYANLDYSNYGGNNLAGSYCGASCNNGNKAPVPGNANNGNDGGLIGTINRSNNLYFGLRSCPANAQTPDSKAGSSVNEACADPQFAGEPLPGSTTLTSSVLLNNYNMALSSTSPAIKAGMTVPGLTLDHNGAAWNIPPSQGAVQYLAAQ